MKIWMIWAVTPHDGHHWLVDAWDDETVTENYDGWQTAKEKAYEEYGPDNVRIVHSCVDFDKVLKTFLTTDVTP